MHKFLGGRGWVVPISLVLILMHTACQASPDASRAAGGSASTLPGGLKEASETSIIYVGCNRPSDFFWARVTRGAQEAADNLGVEYQYLFPETPSDITLLNQKIEQAIAAQPDGIAVCGLDPNASRSVIDRAVEQGIAVVLTPPENSITESPLRDQSLPYIGQAGSDEPAGGILAAQASIERLGSQNLVCTQSQADTTQGVRCRSLIDQAASQGANAEIQIVPNDQGQAADIITNYLRANPEVDTVVTTNAAVALGVIEAKTAADRTDVHLVTFDINDSILAGVQDGTIDFAIDQQQFWRGYIPVLLLVHHVRYGLVMSNNFLTGPNIVDQSNVEAIISLVAESIR